MVTKHIVKRTFDIIGMIFQIILGVGAVLFTIGVLFVLPVWAIINNNLVLLVIPIIIWVGIGIALLYES